MIQTFKQGLVIACLWLLGAASFFMANVAHAALVDVPQLNARVTDLTQSLSQEQIQQLESKLAAFEHEKGSQMAVLIVPSTQPEDIAQFSIRVVDAWKLGREKQDDGVLLLIAKDDRKMRLEVGYGLEGAIPDLTAKRIISEYMAPHFKLGDMYGGIDAAINQVTKLVDGESLPAPTRQNSMAGIENLFPIVLFGGLILGGILRAMFGSFFGGVLNGGAMGLLAWMLGGGLFAAALFGFVAFLITLIGVGNLGAIDSGGGGGWSSAGGGSDSFSGGGGGFGGGGASGDW